MAMSAQQLIKEKHRFEDDVAVVKRFIDEWMNEFALLTNRELETCTAIAMDFAIEHPEEKGLALRVSIPALALKQRASSYRPSVWKRYWRFESADFTAKRFMASKLVIPADLNEDTFVKLLQNYLDGFN